MEHGCPAGKRRQTCRALRSTGYPDALYGKRCRAMRHISPPSTAQDWHILWSRRPKEEPARQSFCGEIPKQPLLNSFRIRSAGSRIPRPSTHSVRPGAKTNPVSPEMPPLVPIPAQAARKVPDYGEYFSLFPAIFCSSPIPATNLDVFFRLKQRLPLHQNSSRCH